ncbi:MAG: hypothetical protein OEW88_12540 [Gammaproteobacteria bacterium]|nr:hypothetical protein [Gammaproteobacteria bacterium]
MAISARLLTPGMLMDFSESRLDVLRYSGTDDERRVISRLLEQPSAYSRWGAFHYPLMQKVAATRNRREQLVRLRQTHFVLLHRQALFEYLRDSQVNGRDREILFGAFYGTNDYSRAVVSEHQRYLQSNSSLFCADHLDIQLMRDTCFTSGFADYRLQYMEYFSLYCHCVIAESRGADYAMKSILLDMKQRLAKSAAQLIALPEYQQERRSARRPWATRGRPASLAAG